MTPKITLSSIAACFQGHIPSSIATCDRDGTPNVSFLSYVHVVDEKRVALSHQFFSKTRKNLRDNPFASVIVHHPVTGEWYRLALRYDHEETTGPLFEEMALRVSAIASETGMENIFRLIAADVFDVLSVRVMEGAGRGAQATTPIVRADMCGLRVLSDRINRAGNLECLFASVLDVMEGVFGFDHSMVLLPDERRERLFTIASRGYSESGLGSEVRFGEGIVGTAARARQMLHFTQLDGERRYARAVRSRAIDEGVDCGEDAPLPHLENVDTQIALPLVVRDTLVGVLSIESARTLRLGDQERAFLGIMANQVALAIERESQRSDASESEPPAGIRASATPAPDAQPRQFCLYCEDDSIFVDGMYLIRNVPARILWTLLNAYTRDGRTEFTNRELRLDASIGVPELKDNLESRLILLRKRLEQKCPDVRIVPTARGRFALEIDGRIALVEKKN